MGLKDPDFGFPPDAEFPTINGEKVILQPISILKVKMMGTLVLCPFNGGLRENMVPESASADFTGPILEKRTQRPN